MVNFVLNVDHSFKAFVGDLVGRVEKSAKGWALVRDSLGGSCWVPEAYLQQSGGDTDEVSNVDSVASASPSPGPATSASTASHRRESGTDGEGTAFAPVTQLATS